MDLIQTLRKGDTSRGGVNFSWDDVKNSNHRENYLGHSLKAPVGRWQAKKDLNWYAKAEDADLTPEERKEKEALARKEELRKVKEAEEDAMLQAMGLPVPDRTNANLEPLGMSKEKQGEVNRALKEALSDDDDDQEKAGLKSSRRDDRRGDRSRDRRRRDGDGERSHRRRRRSRSRSMSRERDRRRRDRHRDERVRSRPRSTSRDRRRRRGDSRDRHEKREDDRYRPSHRDRRRQSRSRSRSPPGHRRRDRYDR